MSAQLLLLLGLVTLLLLLLLRGRTRRAGEPPLITGWIPMLGKALEFGKDPQTFLQEHQKKCGDIFTVLIAGRYMTFVMNPFLYPHISKHGRRLDFHDFSINMAAVTFGFPPMVHSRFPGLQEEVERSYLLLQGDNLTSLTESMMGNLMLVLRRDHLQESAGEGGRWRSRGMFDFCTSVMFDASVLTMYGKPPSPSCHGDMQLLREDFLQFDHMFPLLVAGIPIWLLRRTKAARQKLTSYFLPQRMRQWSNAAGFIRRRAQLFDHYDALRDFDKAAHHLTILWAAVANTMPATFWTLYYLVSHPEATEAIRQEMRDVLGLGGVRLDEDVQLDREQLEKLLYLESAIYESFRLSSSSMSIRVAKEDFTLQLGSRPSVDIRQGDIITLFPPTMHMDPEIYEEPEMFQFDRFVHDGKMKTAFYKDGQKLRYYLMPFGFGSSQCPGQYFAINEIKQFVCVMLLYFDLQLEEGQATPSLVSTRAGLGILPPTTDVRFRYRLRRV